MVESIGGRYRKTKRDSNRLGGVNNVYTYRFYGSGRAGGWFVGGGFGRAEIV